MRKSKSMTVTGEEETTSPTTPSFFQRICCCCQSELKEPPVQLIRSGSLTYQQGAAVEPKPSGNIEAAKKSVDDNEVATSKPATSQQSAQPPEDTDSVNMNDILMENVLKTDEDRTEAVEEDNVSINTNVVQTVDEHELRSALNNEPKLKPRKAIAKDSSDEESSGEEVEGENRKMSVIEFIKSETHAETSTTLPAPQNEKMSEATQSEMSDSEDEVSSEGSKQVTALGSSSKTTARADKTSDVEERRVREFKELSSDESLKGTSASEAEDEPEEKEEEEDVPPPLPSSPPPRLTVYGQPEGSPMPPPRSPQKSRMYADADDSDSEDSDSDDEASASESETDDAPVVGNGLVRMQPVNFAPHKDDEDSEGSEEENEKEKENDDDTLGVTRISVKSDGRAEIHSPKSPVRVSLEPDRNEVTDDDFSEKLI